MLPTRIRSYIANSAWMLTEQLLRLVSGVLVGIYIARYLGPERFGTLSYVLAIVAFLIVVARLGMDAVLVREVARREEDAGHILGTAIALMLLSALGCYTLLLLSLMAVDEPVSVKAYLALASASVFLVAFYALDFYFQARVRAKWGTIAKSLAIACMAVVKLALIWREAQLVWFVAANLVEHLLIAIGLSVMFLRHRPSSLRLSVHLKEVKPLLRSAWPMMLAGVSSLLYMRIDQLMLRHMRGMEEVGVYAAASRIYEAWVLVPFVLSVSLLPALVALKSHSRLRFEIRLRQFFTIITLCTMLAAFIIWWTGEYLIVATFGPSYHESAGVLQLLMVAAIFTAVHSVTVRYLTVEHLETKVASRTLIAAVLNVVANALLIPRLGAQGAAWATLITMFFIAYVMDYLDKDLRQIARIKRLALLKPLPWRRFEPGEKGNS